MRRSLFAEPITQSKEQLDRQYQSAVANYEAGKFSEAANQLESLLPYAQKSFEVHELLGLVYASLSKHSKAEDQLKIAVQLNPNSAAARTNLGASLVHSGKAELAGEQFRKALQLEPQSYDANHNLAEFYIQSGKIADARPLLETAQHVRPDSYENGYDLVMADFQLGRLDDAENGLLTPSSPNKIRAELHNLLGQVYEKDGNFVAAANEFEAAAHLESQAKATCLIGEAKCFFIGPMSRRLRSFQAGHASVSNSPRLFIGLEAWRCTRAESTTTRCRRY